MVPRSSVGMGFFSVSVLGSLAFQTRLNDVPLHFGSTPGARGSGGSREREAPTPGGLWDICRGGSPSADG